MNIQVKEKKEWKVFFNIHYEQKLYKFCIIFFSIVIYKTVSLFWELLTNYFVLNKINILDFKYCYFSNEFLDIQNVEKEMKTGIPKTLKFLILEKF